jgi:GTPase
MNNPKKTAIIVGDRHTPQTTKEMELLLKTLNIESEVIFPVDLSKIHPATFITKGKLEELKNLALALKTDLIVFDDELSYTQIRNLSRLTTALIVDRPRIILDIFASRATTKEGKIQVELAILRKRLPEIVHQNKAFDQQVGFIGGKGPGERKAEITRRSIYQKIHQHKIQLKSLEKQRKTKRDKRMDSDLILISIVGYTNAGKSTLFNALTRDQTPTDDLLFHTLDTKTRKGYLNKTIGSVLFSDTVGFIRKLPHELVEAFKGTLEEIQFADLIMIVVDISDPDFPSHLNTVYQTLKDLKADHIDQLLVYNKADLYPEKTNFNSLAKQYGEGILISALSKESLPELIQNITQKIEDRIHKKANAL